MPSDLPFAIISDEVSQNPAEVAAFMREFGLKAVELRSMFGRAFRDLSLRQIEEIAACARGEGWVVCGCATPVFKCHLDDEAASGEHIEIFRRSIDAALRLGSPLLRVFTFLRQAGANTEAISQRIVDKLRPLCDLAVSAGLRVGIENEASCLIATPVELRTLLKVLHHPAACIIWDPCNVLYVREWSQPVGSGLEDVFQHVRHIHVKDAARGWPAAPVAVPVGHGDVNWAAEIRAARDRGYQGLFSLETHWRLNPLDAEQLHLPAGYAFSEGGEAASRVCLLNLAQAYRLAARS